MYLLPTDPSTFSIKMSVASDKCHFFLLRDWEYGTFWELLIGNEKQKAEVWKVIFRRDFERLRTSRVALGPKKQRTQTQGHGTDAGNIWG